MGLVSTGSNPVFPILMTNLDYAYFINHLKLNIARKNYFFDVKVNRKVTRLIKILYKLNVIRRFVIITPYKYRIYTSWFDRNSNALKLKNYSRALNPIRLKLRSLNILKFNTYNSYLILSTSKGLLTHQEAIKEKVGGFLICTIF